MISLAHAIVELPHAHPSAFTLARPEPSEPCRRQSAVRSFGTQSSALTLGYAVLVLVLASPRLPQSVELGTALVLWGSQAPLAAARWSLATGAIYPQFCLPVWGSNFGISAPVWGSNLLPQL